MAGEVFGLSTSRRKELCTQRAAGPSQHVSIDQGENVWDLSLRSWIQVGGEGNESKTYTWIRENLFMWEHSPLMHDLIPCQGPRR